MTNLIDKFIWIWPSWDIDNKEEHEQTYVIDEIEIGWFMMNKRESKTGIPRKDFCLCQVGVNLTFNHPLSFVQSNAIYSDLHGLMQSIILLHQ